MQNLDVLMGQVTVFKTNSNKGEEGVKIYEVFLDVINVWPLSDHLSPVFQFA